MERQWIYESAWFFWLSSSPLVMLFGIGFGYAYMIPLLGGVLVNTGLVGVAIYFALFLVPLIRLPNTQDTWPLKSALLVILFLLVPLPESPSHYRVSLATRCWTAQNRAREDKAMTSKASSKGSKNAYDPSHGNKTSNVKQ
jgi:hypothetical protein